MPDKGQSEIVGARTTTGKALRVNLDMNIYGAFAEIGAGQEVARHFFQADVPLNNRQNHFCLRHDLQRRDLWQRKKRPLCCRIST
jgi:hypothetical protein